MVERSYDTVRWGLHGWYSETSFSYDRYEGYDQYFRVFAYNDDIGYSTESNIINVHISDTTPPVILIEEPTNNENIISPDIFVVGDVRELNNSGIQDIKIWIDGVARSEPILETDRAVWLYFFESTLQSVSNGNHLLMVSAENGDGVFGSSTISIIVDAPIPKQVSSFEDNFETDMAGWYLATEDDEYWSVRENPIKPVPGSLPGNSVAGTEDCDRKCTMTLIDYVDLTNMEKPQFDYNRYLSSSLDTDEGLEVYVSQDNGKVWGLLDSFMANDGYDDNTWYSEAYDLSNYSDVTEFKVKFIAISTSGSEDIELDDVKIYDAAADTTSPSITVPPNQTFEATSSLTPLTSTDYGTATAIDNVDTNPIIIHNAPDVFPLGDTMITWTATDESGNSASATQIITIEGITPITFTGEWMTNNVLDVMFTQDVAPHLDKTDFTLSSGEILGFYTWHQMDNRLVFVMQGVPENESLTVTYVGDAFDIGNDKLYSGEYFVTSPNLTINP